MEYVIFPMKTINISQRHYSSPSHVGVKAIDIAGTYDHDSGIKEWARAPTTCKVLNRYCENSCNTVLFGTCDKYGNKAKVMCEDGFARVLTFAFTHMDDISMYNKGDIFNTGKEIYQEGTYGYVDKVLKHDAVDIHIHFEVAEGWQYDKRTINGVYQLPNAIFPHQIFHMLKGWNVVGTGSGLNGYTMKKVTSREVKGTVTPPATDLSGCYLNATKSAFRVRSYAVSGDPKVFVPVGQKAEILEFIGIQSDGYQWVKVKYDTYEGYSQLDTKNCYTLSGACSKTLYLYATKSAFRLRTSAPYGSQKEMCPIGGRAKILYFGSIVSDGYQWAYVEYNGVRGWSQMDTKNCYTVNV